MLTGGIAESRRAGPADGQSLGRLLFYAGAFTLPMLTLRVAGATVSDIAFMGSLGMALMAMPGRRALPTSRTVQFALALALVGALLSTFRDPYPLSGAGTILRLVFVWAIWQWLAKAVLETVDHYARAVAAFAVGCGISGVAALAQYRFGLTIPGTELNEAYRVTGLAQHPNDQGGALAVATASAFVGLVYPAVRRRLWLGVAAGCAIGLVLAGSVTGMLSALTGIGVALVGRRFSPRATVTIAVALSTVTWLAIRLQASVGAGSDPVQRLLAATGYGPNPESDTLTDRIETMEAAWAWISESLFVGRGFSDIQTRAVGFTQVHNLLLGMWAAGGLLVIAAVLILFVGAWVKSRAILPSMVRSQLIAGLAASFAFSMTAPIMYQRYAWFPVALLFALAAATGSRHTEQAQGWPLRRRHFEATGVRPDERHGS